MGSCSGAAVCRAGDTTVSSVKSKREGSVLPTLCMLAQVRGTRGHSMICVDMHVVYHYSYNKISAD